MPKRLFYILAGLILALGAWLRLHQLGSVPVSLYWDEVAILVDAKSLVATGLDMHGNHWLQAIFPSYGDYKLPVYIWLATASVKFFGATNLAVRLPSALAGLATIIWSGLITKELFAKQKKHLLPLVLTTMAVMVVTPWSMMFSRIGFEGHLAQFFMAVSIWLAIKWQKSSWWLVGSALLGSLATYTYFSVRFVWPIVFIATVLLTKKINKKTLGLSIVLPLMVYGLSLLPIQRSPFYEASQQLRLSTPSVLNSTDWPVMANDYHLLAGDTLLNRVIYHRHILMLRELASNYADNLSLDFLFFSGDSNLRHGTGQHGLFLWVMVIPFVYGWYTVFIKYGKTGLLLLIWWLAALLPASVPETTPHALRSLNALVPLVVIIGWGSWSLGYNLWRSELKNSFKYLLVVILLLISLASVVDFDSYYFNFYPSSSGEAWQVGYEEMAAEIWQKSQTEQQVIVENFDDRFYLWLLAYQLPAEEYQHLDFVNFRLTAFNNIIFK